MKKLLKNVAPYFCIATLFIGIFSIFTVGFLPDDKEAFSAFASTDYQLRDSYVEEENISLYYEVMSLIEDELRTNNTSVIEQLQNQIDEYQNMLVDNTYNNKKTVESLIKVNNEMIKSYSKYENSKLARKADDPNYTPMITAAIAYFKYKKYLLSAELLSFALENKTLDTHYAIQRTDIIESGTKFKQIVSDTKLKGTTSFEKTGKTVDDDLYYAIHGFSFEKPTPHSRTVTIQDRYDFAYKENPQGALDKILNSMYNAQEAGVLVPFLINETVSLKTKVNLQNEDSFEETFEVEAGDLRYFTVDVYDDANLRIQIKNSYYSTMIEAHGISISSPKSSKNTITTFTFAIGSAPLVTNDNTITVMFSCE